MLQCFAIGWLVLFILSVAFGLNFLSATTVSVHQRLFASTNC
jgi:hypothetical protein